MGKDESLIFNEDIEKALKILKDHIAPDDLYLFLFMFIDGFDEIAEDNPEITNHVSLLYMKVFSQKIMTQAYDLID